MGLPPRGVVVHRASELSELVDRHGTRGQVEFFLRTRGRTLAELQLRQDALDDAIREFADANSACCDAPIQTSNKTSSQSHSDSDLPATRLPEIIIMPFGGSTLPISE